MHVVFLTADDVATYGKKPGRARCIRFFLDANICAFGRTGSLNGVRRNSHLVYTGTFGSSIYIDFGSRFRCSLVRAMIIIFDVVASDLKVANFGTLNANATQSIVTDVTSGDVDLVQVNPIEKNACTSVEINMAMTDENVPIALDQMDAMPTPRNHYALENRLHRLDQFKAICLRMGPFHLNVFYRRQALMIRDIALSTTRITRAAMRANQTKSRSLACHQHTGRASRTINPQRTPFGKIDLNRGSNAISPRRKMQDSIALFHRMTNRLRIINLAVCRSSKSGHITHAFKLGPSTPPVNTPKEGLWNYLSNSAKDS